jgi:hypothetical protein
MVDGTARHTHLEARRRLVWAGRCLERKRGREGRGKVKEEKCWEVESQVEF